jgi:hypothetical protein
LDEKPRREEQLLLIEQKRQELEEERQNLAQIRYSIDQRNHDLEVRENKLIELEPFVPGNCVSAMHPAQYDDGCGPDNKRIHNETACLDGTTARQLQAMKIDITNFLPWAETVHEYAVTQNTDLTTAAFNIANDLREYRQLGSLHKVVDAPTAITTPMMAIVVIIVGMFIFRFTYMVFI